MKEIIKNIVAAFAKPTETINEHKYLVHESYNVKEFDKPLHWKPDLSRHVIAEQIINKDDFIAFVDEYKTSQTKIFYSDLSVKAIFNYIAVDMPDHGDSMCKMPLIYTDEFKSYTGHVGQELSQKDFVRFLKKMEPFIKAFDNKKADAMDIIEMAESLQGISQVDSIQRNAHNKFTINAEVRTSKADMTIPRIITFELPIYKNERLLTARFETELFLTESSGSFIAELMCYNIDQLVEEAQRQLTVSICDEIKDVSSFAI